jgi:branched-chain amino acid transport system permease protein
MSRRPLIVIAAALVVALVIGRFLPGWVQSLLILALGKGLVVLGLLLLMRCGLVSFGQGLFYALGAYASVSITRIFQLPESLLTSDAFIMPLAGGIVAGALAFVLGFLLAGYRSIFFAMLSLAFSMILYGLLIKSALLGSSDGFNVAYSTAAGIRLPAGSHLYALLAVALVFVALALAGTHAFVGSHTGRLGPAVRDNELRVEYMGASVRRIVHLNYVLAAVLSGIGGGLVALSIGHIDPDLAYWTTSGEFVFVAILSGTANVAAPFLGSLVFEWIKSVAYQYTPDTWQLVLGAAMLAVIMFMPEGLWSLFTRRRKAA